MSYHMMRMLSVTSLILAYLTFCWGAVYQNYGDLPNSTYDFVIIGGGTAGAVLANRLTENPGFTVLIIEAGPSNAGIFNELVPLFSTKLQMSPYDWNFTTTAQSGLNGRSVAYPRGHILGGSSSINGMFYTRGSSSDYDRFAKITGDSGWSWDRMQPYIRKNEKWTAPADNHDTAGQFNASVHGFNGINAVSLYGSPQQIDARVIQTTKDLKDEFPFNVDMNSGNPLGLGWFQGTILKGQRSSAATSYLAPAFVSRPNLHILLETRVTRVLSTGMKMKRPIFHSVEIAKTENGSRWQLAARKEVILCAGAISTPHILLNSGIGDEVALRQLGIEPILHLPSVGKNLTDQPILPVSWIANSNNTLDNLNNNATVLLAALEQFNKTHTGPLVYTGSNQIAWMRIPSNSTIFQQFADPSSGPNSAHYELTFSNGAGIFSNASGHFIGSGLAVVAPLSRGFVALNTKNPFDPPVINPGFFDSDFDMFAMKAAIESIRRFYAGPAWNNYVLDPAGAFANASTDALLEDYIRDNSFSGAHPVGTAAMSSEASNYGVINPDLLLKRASGLRIVDASVMPFVTCGHTQAPVYVIAERAADLIKSTWA